MLASSLNSSVMAGVVDTNNLMTGDATTGQVDAAGTMLDRHINIDSCFPTLSDKLQIQPKGN